MQTSSGKGGAIAGSFLVYLVGVLLVGSSVAKFAGIPKVVEHLAALGFDGPRLTLIATLEILSAVLFVVPRTRVVGLLLASAYLGGAIATHIQHGQPPSQPAFVLALMWAGIWLRYPGFISSLSTVTTSTPSPIPATRRESLAASRQAV